ncbi:Polysaccharide lyase [Phytophthora cinnamomi]|uniref:Polysaccharide lyase n=1 Tax=Phytophthora cinnamomi TaxID=4785 RepID=UPI003559EF76|nr:Polysaccharide lyase [Phytophthora cinnamomi]
MEKQNEKNPAEKSASGEDEGNTSESLFCDVCFGFLHRRGGLKTHRTEPLLELYALSVKGGNAASVTRVLGGGARYADDKVIQHNGLGTVIIDGFFAQDFGKLYRSCGSCKNNPAQRFLNIRNVYADLEIIKAQRVDPNVSIVMMNENYNDEAVLRNIYVKPGAENYTECGWSRGVQKGDHPLILGNGPKNPVCQYSMNDIHLVNGKGGLQQQ